MPPTEDTRKDCDVEICTWCNGDGIDHATSGNAVKRDCARCDGSGKIYVTGRESLTGRRRVYKAAAPAGLKFRGPNAPKNEKAWPPIKAARAARKKAEKAAAAAKPATAPAAPIKGAAAAHGPYEAPNPVGDAPASHTQGN